MNIPVRDARDRLIELLGLGQPYPLRDLIVSGDIKVVWNQPARILIEDSQADVRYQLHDQRQVVLRPDNTPVEVVGTGGVVELITNAIAEDNTFEIYAIKPNGLAVYLYQAVIVRVGLNTGLKARILSGDPLGNTKLVDYAVPVTVEVEGTQEGVDYRLVTRSRPNDGRTEKSLSAQVERGNLGTIQLTADPLFEDTDIRIRATRAFTDNQRDSELLDIVLPLKVRANPALEVATPPILPYNTGSTLTIAKTQASASYRVFSRLILDTDYVRTSVAPSSVITVAEADEPQVQVCVLDKPVATTLVPVGDPQTGNGGPLTFTLPAMEEDTQFIVQATKAHSVDERNLDSAVWLTQQVVVLVRPNPAPPLALTVTLIDGQTDGTLLVEGGQPGVFYAFTPKGGTEIEQQAYFYKPRTGLEDLALEVDFVIPRDELREQPLLDTPPIAADTPLNIMAKKAQTQIAVPLTNAANIAALPPVTVQDAEVVSGATTRILVTDSVTDDRYQVFHDGAPFKQPRNGNGGEIVFVTDPVTAETTYTVVVTRPGATHPTVTRIVPLTIRVRPQ